MSAHQMEILKEKCQNTSFRLTEDSCNQFNLEEIDIKNRQVNRKTWAWY